MEAGSLPGIVSHASQVHSPKQQLDELAQQLANLRLGPQDFFGAVHGLHRLAHV